MTYRPVTCVGARKLPTRERPRLMHVSRELEALGYTIRSGDAIGSDAAFVDGLAHPERAEVYPPDDVCEQALALAAKHHPAWHRCNDDVRRLHARNMYQVLGRDLASPSLFVVCWTPGAKDVGGTGQAIRVARRLSIPVYNLADEHHVRRLNQVVFAGKNVLPMR